MNLRREAIGRECLTAADLQRRLAYDADTGVFTHREAASPRCPAGSVAGCRLKTGYVLVRIKYTRHCAHRLAWLYVYGEWPKGQIDHIDGDPSNNRIGNLRDVSQSENMHNLHGLAKNNTSGVRGVTFHKGSRRWRALITVNGDQKLLGSFATKHGAINARKAAEIKLHPTAPRHD